MQLCLALLGMLLVGIDRTEVFEGCVTVSVLIHYFTLVAVMWMGAEALLMFQKLVIVFVQITTRYIIIVSLVCWCKLTIEIANQKTYLYIIMQNNDYTVLLHYIPVAPILPVLISLSIDPRFMVSYRQVQSIVANTTSQEELQL